MSTFCGIIKEIPNISVDRFDGDNLLSTAFFLSHCHSDHMRGLKKPHFLDHLAYHNYVLYCSKISYSILMNTCVKNYKEHVKVLDVCNEVIVHVPSGAASQESQDITVSVLPAGHCPGSVMFLFESVKGRILYSGDIRFVEGDIGKLKPLLDVDGNVKQIECLYLDTTFLSPAYKYFPPRQESASTLCCMIDDWISKSPDHYVHLKTPAKHGSEYLYTEIFKTLKVRVHVSSESFGLYRTVPEVESAITASPALTQVHACYNNGEPCDYLTKNTQRLIRVIKPSAMWFENSDIEDEIWSIDHDGMFKVAYSSHSSYSELKDIIKCLKPKNIEACVIPPKKTKEDTLKLLSAIQSEVSDVTAENDEMNGSSAECYFTRLKTWKSQTQVLLKREQKDGSDGGLSSPPRQRSRFD